MVPAALPSTDLNDLRAPGFYQLNVATTNGLVATGTLTSAATLLVMPTANSRISQVLFHNNDRVFFRTLQNTAWTAWREIPFLAVDGVRNPATNAENVQLTRASGGAALSLPNAVGGTDAARRAGMMSGLDKQRLDALHAAFHPVGSYYTQYPVATATTHAAMFPAARTPAQLFGGTWTERFQGEEVFFGTTGGGADTSGAQLGARRGQRWNVSAWAAGGVAGIEPDMIRNIAGGVNVAGLLGNVETRHQSGALAMGGYGSTPRSEASGSVPGGIDIDASRVAPTGAVCKPRNRLVRVWERTA